jgi:hypothetical protein
MDDDYPVGLSIDYPERDLNRLTSALRIFTLIPIAIALGTIGGYSTQWGALAAAAPRRSRCAAPACCSCRRC